jgi:hypothetical protein
VDLGTLAPMVQFLPSTSTALIESIPSEAHDMEGIHNDPHARDFFDSLALKPGKSIHRNDLNALAPSVGQGG